MTAPTPHPGAHDACPEHDVEWVRCPACRAMCPPTAWACDRCGERLPEPDDDDPGALLDRLEELAKAATERPWHVMRSADDRRAYAITTERVVTDSAGCSAADAALIVAMHTALPDLLCLARDGLALRAEVERLAEAVEMDGHRFGIQAAGDSARNDMAAFAEHETACELLRDLADRIRAVVADTSGEK